VAELCTSATVYLDCVGFKDAGEEERFVAWLLPTTLACLNLGFYFVPKGLPHFYILYTFCKYSYSGFSANIHLVSDVSL
jgi:hypothetical protein